MSSEFNLERILQDVHDPVLQALRTTIDVIATPESEADFDTATEELDLSESSVFLVDLGTTAVTSLSFLNPTEGGRYSLVLLTDTSAAITWPSSVLWAGGSAPTLTTSGIDVVTMIYVPETPEITSGNPETYDLNAIDSGADVTMRFTVDGGDIQTLTIGSGDAVDFGAVTAAEVATAFNAQITGATADGSSGSVVVTSDTRTASSSIKADDAASGGDLNDATNGLDFSTTEVTADRFLADVSLGFS